MMITRILEPELMDSPAEAIAYDRLDHEEVNRRFVSDLLLCRSVTGDVLDLGTGTARIPLELCARSEDVRVMAIDMSVSMLDIARLNLAISPFEQRIMLDLVDAKQLPYRVGTFGTVISNSLVHHLPEPALMMAEAVRVCAPGGFLFFRDLIRPESMADLEERVANYGGESFEGRKLLADSLHAALSLSEVQAIVGDLGFAAESVTITSDRHWTWKGIKPETTPRSVIQYG